MYFTNPYALQRLPPKLPARQPVSVTLARVVAQFAAAGIVTAKANAKIAAIKAEIAKGNTTMDAVTRGKARIATIEAGIAKLNVTMDALEARVCVKIKKFATSIVAVRAITAGLGCAGLHCTGTGGVGREVEVPTTMEPMSSSTPSDCTIFTPHTLVSRRSARNLFSDDVLETWRLEFPALVHKVNKSAQGETRIRK